MVTIVEYCYCSGGCVAECLLINCVAAVFAVAADRFVVAELVAYLVVHSFVVIALTYFVVIFVNFVDRCDGSDLSCSL